MNAKNPLDLIKKLGPDENFLLESFLEALQTGALAGQKVQHVAQRIRIDGIQAFQRLLQPMGLMLYNEYHFEFHRADGSLLYQPETVKNITVNVGLDEILDKFWKGSSYTAAHHVGVTQGSPTFAAGDTMSSHAGWTEDQDYSESTRQALTLGTVSSQSVDNSASKAVFTANASTTMGGAFITTNNTKGGTTGILIGGAALSADKSLANTETLTLTVTLTAASA